MTQEINYTKRCHGTPFVVFRFRSNLPWETHTRFATLHKIQGVCPPQDPDFKSWNGMLPIMEFNMQYHVKSRKKEFWFSLIKKCRTMEDEKMKRLQNPQEGGTKVLLWYEITAPWEHHITISWDHRENILSGDKVNILSWLIFLLFHILILRMSARRLLWQEKRGPSIRQISHIQTKIGARCRKPIAKHRLQVLCRLKTIGDQTRW